MEKSINLAIVETKQTVLQVLQQSQLPAAVCAMIMHEVSMEVDNQTNQILAQEKAQFEASQKSDKELSNTASQ